MTIDELYEKIKPIFNAINYPVPGFDFIQETGDFVSNEYYTKDDVDYIVLVNPAGKVAYGLTDGVVFTECGILGYI